MAMQGRKETCYCFIDDNPILRSPDHQALTVPQCFCGEVLFFPVVWEAPSPGALVPVSASAVTKIGSMSVGSDFNLSSAFCVSGRMTLKRASMFFAPS